MQNPMMPKILIANFGTFRPSFKKISNYMRKSFKLRKLGRLDKEKNIEMVKKLWPVKNRLAEENNGINTWKKYRKKLRDGNNKA